jgi:hypothetical protein
MTVNRDENVVIIKDSCQGTSGKTTTYVISGFLNV